MLHNPGPHPRQGAGVGPSMSTAAAGCTHSLCCRGAIGVYLAYGTGPLFFFCFDTGSVPNQFIGVHTLGLSPLAGTTLQNSTTPTMWIEPNVACWFANT